MNELHGDGGVALLDVLVDELKLIVFAVGLDRCGGSRQERGAKGCRTQECACHESISECLRLASARDEQTQSTEARAAVRWHQDVALQTIGGRSGGESERNGGANRAASTPVLDAGILKTRAFGRTADNCWKHLTMQAAPSGQDFCGQSGHGRSDLTGLWQGVSPDE